MIGAGVAAWLVWSLTKPAAAGAAELPQTLPPGGFAPPASLPGKATGSRLPATGQNGSGTQQPTANSQQPSTLLRRGSSGPAVLAWQTTLVYGGYLPDQPSSRDAAFGPVTEAATKAFQEEAGVKIDGIVGPETRAAAARLIQGV